MISFMFATLGSVSFWAIYFMVSVFATVITLKIVDKTAFDYVVLKDPEKDLNSVDAARCVALTVSIFMLWPVFLFAAFVYRVLIKMLWPVFCNVLSKANTMIPTVTFGDEKKDDTD